MRLTFDFWLTVLMNLNFHSKLPTVGNNNNNKLVKWAGIKLSWVRLHKICAMCSNHSPCVTPAMDIQTWLCSFPTWNEYMDSVQNSSSPPFVRPYIRWSILLSVRPSARASFSCSVLPPVHSCVRLSVFSSVYISVRISVRQSDHPSFRSSIRSWCCLLENGNTARINQIEKIWRKLQIYIFVNILKIL